MENGKSDAEFRPKGIEFEIKGSGCWEITSHKPNKVTGYPQIRLNGCGTTAHRYVYKVFVGEIEEGLVVRHTCDNPLCINPDHLLTGTKADNAADCVSRERTPRGAKNGQVKLTEAQVLEIFALQDKHTATARRFGVSEKAIRKIRSGENWSWLTGGHQNAAR